MNRTVRGLQGQRYRSFRPSEQLFYGEILYRPNFSRPTLTIDLRVFRDLIRCLSRPKMTKSIWVWPLKRATITSTISSSTPSKKGVSQMPPKHSKTRLQNCKNAGVSRLPSIHFWHLLFLCLLFLLVGLSRFKAQLPEDGDLHLAGQGRKWCIVLCI